MKRMDGIMRAPGGGSASLRIAATPDRVGRALDAVVIVATGLATARACGAWIEDPEEAKEAFESADDPADFGDGPEGEDGPH